MTTPQATTIATSSPLQNQPITSPEHSPHFKNYRITRSGISDYQLISEPTTTASQSESESQYYIEISLYNPSKRDVILHSGLDSKGPILGDADLKNFSGHYTIELGDYTHAPVTLERLELDKVKGWSSRHCFEFDFGRVHGGDRDREGVKERFVWRHKGEMFSDGWGNMELVTDRDVDEEDVLMAQYLAKDPGYRGWKGRGKLLVKGDGGLAWERMVILSLMALLVTRRREQ